MPSIVMMGRLRFIFLLYSMYAIFAATVSICRCNETDQASLLAFKEKIDPHSGALSSWNQTTNFCVWAGVTCSQRHPMRVVALDLPSRSLVGTISPSIGNLTFLRRIRLDGNGLYGQIPSTLGLLRQLRILNLTDNLLHGVIPTNLSFCSRLTQLILISNQLQGRIPDELGSLSMLNVLALDNNSFTGTIPRSLANLSVLTVISIMSNNLVGPIPENLGYLTSLKAIQLSGNSLSGTVPPPLYNLSSLSYFAVAANQLHGILPSNMGSNLPSLRVFLSDINNFGGAVPASISNLSKIEELDISDNNFSGRLHPGIGRLQTLSYLRMHDNQLEASNPGDWEFLNHLTNCTGLKQLYLDHNRLGGELPPAVANLSTQLQELYLGGNNISGSIPPGIGNLVSLEGLVLHDNLLTGFIPQDIGKLSRLKQLNLNGNNLAGPIPSSLGNLTELNILVLAFNRLQGPIPAALGDLQQLTYLNLYSNNLNGSIPKEIVSLPFLSRSLILSNNLLVGSLPAEVGRLKNLGYFAVSGNQLSGEIPDTLGNCQVLEYLLMDDNFFLGSIPPNIQNTMGLQVLNLTQNNLSGTIPEALGYIDGLQELYLSHNNLSGRIPGILQNLTSRFELDISFNNLEGEVPKDGVFRNVSALSITGNARLCGGIPQLHLLACTAVVKPINKRRWPIYLRIVTPITGVILLFILLLAAVLQRRKFKLQKKDTRLSSLVADQCPRISYAELLKATNGFSPANLIGQGRYGSVYKGTLDNVENTTVAVKVFNLQQSGSSKSFIAECKALRRARHRNLIKIITCCSSIDHSGEDFKALVFEFMPNNSLESWLHPKIDEHREHNTLSLSQRLNIAVDAVDAADALDYLHHSCQPAIVHCDMKPSNILLHQDMSARVGDFRLAKLIPEAVSMPSLGSSSTSFGIRGSIGYIAPEYGEGSRASTSGDVYSFGITLLEMFTGKSPTDDMFKNGLNLQRFAEAAFPERVVEIVDPAIYFCAEDNTTAVRNIGTSISWSKIEQCLVSVVKLGLLCSKQSPKERMSMRDAAIEMHAIRSIYLGVGIHGGRSTDTP